MREYTCMDVYVMRNIHAEFAFTSITVGSNYGNAENRIKSRQRE